MQNKNFKKFSVSEARRKNRFNSLKKGFKTLFLLLLVFGAVFFAWEKLVKIKLFEKNLNNFLISAGCDDGVVLEKMSKGFCLFGGHNLSFYENDGTRNKVFDFNLEKPAVHCCNNLALVYDKNGKFCSLFNSEKNLCSVICDDKILFAKVAENGNFIVVTQSDSFFSKFVVFDKNGRQLFKWNSAENLIVDFDFSKAGSGCHVCTLGVSEDGLEKAVVYGFEFDKNKEVSKKALSETVPVFLKTFGSGFGLVCFNKFFLFDGNCGVVKELQFNEDWNSFFVNDKNYFVFSFSNRVVAYDRFANVFGKVELNEVARKIKREGKHVFILVDGKLVVCNLSLKVLKTIELNKNADDFFCNGKYGYFLFGGKVEKIKIF